jgi:hypothetical protein
MLLLALLVLAPFAASANVHVPRYDRLLPGSSLIQIFLFLSSVSSVSWKTASGLSVNVQAWGSDSLRIQVAPQGLCAPRPLYRCRRLTTDTCFSRAGAALQDPLASALREEGPPASSTAFVSLADESGPMGAQNGNLQVNHF